MPESSEFFSDNKRNAVVEAFARTVNLYRRSSFYNGIACLSAVSLLHDVVFDNYDQGTIIRTAVGGVAAAVGVLKGLQAKSEHAYAIRSLGGPVTES